MSILKISNPRNYLHAQKYSYAIGNERKLDEIIIPKVIGHSFYFYSSLGGVFLMIKAANTRF